eukprot:UC4_evm8s507
MLVTIVALLFASDPPGPGHRPILFLHLHKGAGSFLCQLAKHNGLHASHGNCLVQKDQRCCGGDSVAEQIQFAQTTRYDFVANEKFLYQAIVPNLFTHITILRDSWSRYISHFRHVCRAYNLPSEKTDFWAWVEGQPDNWNVRHICGTRCMLRPKFALTQSDYSYTLGRLRLFDYVIHLDSNHTNFVDELFALCRGLKWTKCSTSKENAAPTKASDKYLRPPQFDRMTFLDDCLFRNLTHEECFGGARYFQSNTNIEFESPCGKKCTRY